MKNFFLLGALFWGVLLALALPATSKEAKLFSQKEKSQYYPTGKEIYEDCNAATKVAERDMRSFMKTYCASQITGYLMGIYRMAPLPRAIKVGEPEDPCHRVYDDVYEKYQSVICIPKEYAKSDIPVELHIAKDIVSYMEKRLPSDKSMNKPQPMGFSGNISLIYSCLKDKQEKK